MPKYAHIDVLDHGVIHLRDNATRLLLLKTYTAGDSYATVIANKLAEVAMTTLDFAISGADAAPRVLTTTAKPGVTASASSGPTPDLHFALTDNVGKVLAVTDETSNQEIVSGNSVNFPSLTYTSNQP